MLKAAQSVAPEYDSQAGREGFLLQIKNRRSELAATDGARLVHLETFGATPGVTGECRCVFRWKIAEALQELAREADSGVSIEIVRRASTLNFRANDRYLDGGPISDSFPDYEHALLCDRPLIARLNPRSFQGAIERATSALDWSPLIRIRADADRLIVSGPLNEIGEGVQLDYQGPRIGMTFNSEFLLDAVRLFDSSDITLKFGSSADGVEIASAEAADHVRLRCVIMPMRV